MKSKFLLIVPVIFILSLVSCFPDGTKELSQEEFISDLTSVPKELNETLDDNLIIDADVTVPEKMPNKTYKVVTKNWNIEKVEDAFLEGKEILKKEENPSNYDESIVNYSYELSDGSVLGVNDGNIYFFTPESYERQYYRYVMGQSPFIDYELKERFPKDTLEYVDKEVSVNSFKDICSKLGIEIYGEPIVYALDMESLDKETDYSQENPKTGEKIQKWTKEDEVYFITAQVLYDEFPMTQFGYTTKSGYGTGTRLSAYYGVNGLVSFTLSDNYQIIDGGEEIDKICSLKIANNVIKEKYKNTILSNPVNISEIRLEYVPVQNIIAKGDTIEDIYYDLIPMWIYTVYQDEEYEKNGEIQKNTNAFQIYVNALTGAEFDVRGVG